MSVFCRSIRGMLRSKVMDDDYICGLPSKHLPIIPYGFLRVICTSTDFWEKSVHWEKFVHIWVRIFGSEKLKNDEIFMERYNVTDWCYALHLRYAVIFCTWYLHCEPHLLHNSVTLWRCVTVLRYMSVPNLRDNLSCDITGLHSMFSVLLLLCLWGTSLI